MDFEESFGIRLEDDILITEKGHVNLVANIPIEADDIEKLMADKKVGDRKLADWRILRRRQVCGVGLLLLGGVNYRGDNYHNLWEVNYRKNKIGFSRT